MSRQTPPSRLYDPKRLIQEVKKRPVIWDRTLPEHLDKLAKAKAWTEVTLEFNDEPDASGSELIYLERELQKKWKNIRDIFTKEYRREQNLLNNIPVTKTRPYLYYEDLQFLKKLRMEPGEYVEETDYKAPFADYSQIAKTPNKRKRKQDTEATERKSKTQITDLEDENETSDDNEEFSFAMVKEEMMNVDTLNPLNTTVSSDAEDSERMFLLSLVKPLKLVPESSRLTVQMEILRVIQKAIGQSNN